MQLTCCMRRFRATPRCRGFALRSCPMPSCREGPPCSRMRQGPVRTAPCVSSLLRCHRARIVTALVGDRLRGDGKREALPFRVTRFLVQLLLLPVRSSRRWSSTHAIGVDLEDQTRDLEAKSSLGSSFWSLRPRLSRRPAAAAPADLLPVLEPQGSGAEVHRGGFALWPRCLRVRAGPKAACRSCAPWPRRTGAI